MSILVIFRNHPIFRLGVVVSIKKPQRGAYINGFSKLGIWYNIQILLG